MKNGLRTTIVLLAICAALAIWWHGIAPRKTPTPPQPDPVVEKEPPRTNEARYSPLRPAPNAEAIPVQDEKLKKLAKLESAINVPIVFYGKVLDQFKRPVEGVRVQAAYNFWNQGDILNMRPQRATNIFYTDPTGMFVVEGLKGSGIDVFLDKSGYELAPQSPISFPYGYPASPPNVSSSSPVMYLMWARQGGANLLRRKTQITVTADGRPACLNLKTRHWEVGATSGLGPTVRIWRQPLVYIPRVSWPTNWQYDLIWPGGKLQFTDDVFCYVAPEQGYQEKLHREFRATDPDYPFRDSKKFYFINKEGHYGSGSLEIWADYQGEVALIVLSVSWNPEGSRNLEPSE